MASEALTPDFSLAQKLYDTYMTEAESQRDEIIGSANAEAETIRNEALAEAIRIREEIALESENFHIRIQKEVDEKMGALEADSTQLENRIAALKTFEEGYKNQLRSLIQQGVDYLDSTTPDKPSESNVDAPEATVEPSSDTEEVIEAADYGNEHSATVDSEEGPATETIENNWVEEVVDEEGYNYRVEWSDEEQAFVATVDEFPSLSWVDVEQGEALSKLRELIEEAGDEPTSEEA